MQRDSRSGLPAGMLLHTPRDALSAHDLQVPWQAVWQHTPCSQKLWMHSAALAHAEPSGLSPHDPLTQTAGGWHCASVEQIGLHRSVAQVYGKQPVLVGVTQAPLPSQVEIGVNWFVADGHIAPLHTVPDGQRWHWPASHLPFVSQVD
jgi:hypothetical protein